MLWARLLKTKLGSMFADNGIQLYMPGETSIEKSSEKTRKRESIRLRKETRRLDAMTVGKETRNAASILIQAALEKWRAGEFVDEDEFHGALLNANEPTPVLRDRPGPVKRTDFSARLPDGGDVVHARDIADPLFVLRLFESALVEPGAAASALASPADQAARTSERAHLRIANAQSTSDSGDGASSSSALPPAANVPPASTDASAETTNASCEDFSGRAGDESAVANSPRREMAQGDSITGVVISHFGDVEYSQVRDAR